MLFVLFVNELLQGDQATSNAMLDMDHIKENIVQFNVLQFLRVVSVLMTHKEKNIFRW